MSKLSRIDAIINLQPSRLELLKSSDAPPPRLFGVSISIKDDIDTEDYPTEFGYSGTAVCTPGVDALLVHCVREAACWFGPSR